MRDYVLEYIPSDYAHKDNIRRYILAFAVILDFGAILTIFTAIISPFYWFFFASLIIISIISRYFANIYPKKYTYGIIENDFIIKELSPLKKKIIYQNQMNDMISIEMADETLSNTKFNDKNNVILCDYSCMNDVYMVKFSDKIIICKLDEYAYTLIKSQLN